MIFVTVGTHEQPFDRLVKYIDDFVGSGEINEEIVIQTGYSTYIPQNCIWQRTFPYQQMKRKVTDARVIITHGGPSSFIMPLQIGKIPIVVPRKKDYGEHVNDHQLSFCRAVAERMGTIIVIENINKLGETIQNYQEIISDMNKKIENNNERFCARFEEVVDGLIKK